MGINRRSVLDEADKAKYRKPKNANGSRARYFFAKLRLLFASVDSTASFPSEGKANEAPTSPANQPKRRGKNSLSSKGKDLWK